MVNVLAIVQARMSSRRLPGKVLKPILGKPMLIHQVERVQRARSIDQIVVATSREDTDDVVLETCKRYSVEVFRGSLDDVLDRFYQLSLIKSPKHIVRITADCPLIDPSVIDQVIQMHLDGGYDYTSNVYPHSFPDGLDTEVLRFETLRTAWSEAKTKDHREHVTSYIVHNPERFKIGHFRNAQDLSKLRWTVDSPEDFQFVEQVFNRLYPENQTFTMQDILQLTRRAPGQ